MINLPLLRIRTAYPTSFFVWNKRMEIASSLARAFHSLRKLAIPPTSNPTGPTPNHQRRHPGNYHQSSSESCKLNAELFWHSPLFLLFGPSPPAQPITDQARSTRAFHRRCLDSSQFRTREIIKWQRLPRPATAKRSWIHRRAPTVPSAPNPLVSSSASRTASAASPAESTSPARPVNSSKSSNPSRLATR